MSALEQEIIEKLHQLDDAQKIQVLEFIERVYSPQFSHTDWVQRVETFQAEIHSKYGNRPQVSVQDLLDEVQEERLDDLMGSPIAFSKR